MVIYSKECLFIIDYIPNVTHSLQIQTFKTSYSKSYNKCQYCLINGTMCRNIIKKCRLNNRLVSNYISSTLSLFLISKIKCEYENSR